LRHRIYPFVILGALIASGCSGGGGTPHTATSPTPSASATASASASPTPTPTSTGSPSASPTPTGTTAITGTGLYIAAEYPNSFTRVTTTLTVPPAPPATGAVIVWPGLVPWSAGNNPTYLPISDGTLQTVLSWGTTCAQATQPTPYSTWWISAQYNNFDGQQAGYTGCQSGSIMPVNPGDSLVETLTLNGTVWDEQVSDQTTSQSVSFQIDLLGQTQNLLYFYMQGNGQNPVGAVSFSNTSFTTSTAFSSANACDLMTAGTYEPDTQSPPTLSGSTCSIASMTLYPSASPVPALQGHAAVAASRFLPPPFPSQFGKN